MAQPTKLPISLCMIVKNEALRLRACLESVSSVVKQMIVVDTGSEDNTVEIAQNCGAEVYHHPWEGSFAKARNYSLSYATQNWILILDGDECLDPLTVGQMNLLPLDQEDIEAFNFIIVNFTTDRAIETEAGLLEQVRLFRNIPTHAYNGLVHNQLMNINEQRNLDGPIAPIRVLHYGYTPSVWRAQNKDARIEIHEKAVQEDPQNHFIRYNYGNHLKILKRYDEALEQFILAIPPMSLFAGIPPDVRATMSEMQWGLSACFLGAFCANKLKEHHIAISLIDEALTRQPLLADARLRGAEAYIALEQYQEAINLLLPALHEEEVVVVKKRALHFDIPYRLGRAYFLSNLRAQATATFASIVPLCEDITVFTHLCLCALSLNAPELWRYSRQKGATLAPDDPDWPIVDQEILIAEQQLSRIEIPIAKVHILPDRALEASCVNMWSTLLEEGLEFFGEDYLKKITIDSNMPIQNGFVLRVSQERARLSYSQRKSEQEIEEVYRFPEHYQAPHLAKSDELVALLISHLRIFMS